MSAARGSTRGALSETFGRELRPPGRVRHGGRERTQAVVEVDCQPYPVRFRWELDGELALVEIAEPAVDPSWPPVLVGLGEPGVVARSPEACCSTSPPPAVCRGSRPTT